MILPAAMDTWHNALRAERLGTSLTLPREDLTMPRLTDIMHEVRASGRCATGRISSASQLFGTHCWQQRQAGGTDRAPLVRRC